MTLPHQNVTVAAIVPPGVATAAGFLRLPQVLQLIPVGRTTWWQGVKSGRYPPGVKLSEGVTAWPLADIVNLAEELKSGRAGGEGKVVWHEHP